MLHLLIFVLLRFVISNDHNIDDSRPMCSPDNLKLGDIEKAVWYLEMDGTLKLSFSHCKLRLFTGNEATECLLDNHIVFIGDSLSRYFYLSLATLLGTGAWSPKLTHRTSKSYPPSLLSERDFATWADFYRFTNQQLNDVRTSSYEVCDCHRDDMMLWDDLPDPVGCPEGGLVDGFCNQQESCVENRHFRSYHKVQGEGLDLDSTPGSDAAAKLSYIQFYGSMPLRGRSSLSLRLPDAEEDFVRYLNRTGAELCPLALADQEFPPPVFYSQKGNASALAALHFWSRDAHYNNAHTARHRRPVLSALQPISWECGLVLRRARDVKESLTRLDFPGFYDDMSGLFEEQVLGPLGASHLVVNIGFHSALPGYADNETKNRDWLRRRVKAARKHYTGGKKASRRLALPQVTWRGTTAFAPFAALNDRNAREVRDELLVEAKSGTGKSGSGEGGGVVQDLELGVFDIYDMTRRLWGLHRLMQRLGGSVDLILLRAIELGLEQEYHPPLLAASNHTSSVRGAGELGLGTGWVKQVAGEWRGLNIRLGSRLNATASHVAGVLEEAGTVGDDHGRLRRHRHVLHKRMLKIPVVYVDMAHPQPWVYNEINNMFLNSICQVKV